MKEFFNKPDFGLLIMRIGLGSLMIHHGVLKFMSGPGTLEGVGKSLSVFGLTLFPLFMGVIAALIEALGGFLFMLGYKFRLVSFFLFCVMFIAASWTYDMNSNLGFAVIGKMAQPIELGVVFLGLLFIGPGKYSADKG